MRNWPKFDFVLAFVIVCIAVTLTVVVAFATPGEPVEMHHAHPFPPTEEKSQ